MEYNAGTSTLTSRLQNGILITLPATLIISATINSEVLFWWWLKVKKGRPKQHSSATERFRAYRERMKQAGYKRLTFEVPHEFKVMFDRLCEKQNVTAREMFCILVAHYEDEEEARVQPENHQRAGD